MNVTFVMDGGDNLSGGHRAIAMLADGLQRLGHHVSLIARPQRPPGLRDKLRWLVRKGCLPSQTEPRPSHFRTIGRLYRSSQSGGRSGMTICRIPMWW